MVRFQIDDRHSVTLNDAEQTALIQLGRASSFEAMPQEALDGLIRKGAVKQEGKGIILTDLGETMYYYVSKPSRIERRVTR